MSSSESKKAVKRRKNNSKATSCSGKNKSNEFAFAQDNIFQDQEALADMENLMDADDLPKTMIARGPNPYLGTEQCLLCHRKRSNPPSPEPRPEKGDGTDDASKLLCDTASLAQLPLWVCADCRRSVEEDTRRDCSDYPVLASGSLLLPSASEFVPCLVHEAHRLHMAPCETCARKRDSEQEQETSQLQTDWIELHYAIWQIYRKAGIDNIGEEGGIYHASDEPPMERIEELVNRLCLLDPHQLFQRLEIQVNEVMISSKMHLLQLLPAAMSTAGNQLPSVQAAALFVEELLGDYSKLCLACMQLAPLLKQLESENLKKFNLTWDLVNRHLFQTIVHMDPHIQKSLACIVNQLKNATSEDCLSHLEACNVLYQRYISFNDEMVAISKLWQREAEHFIQEYNAEQLALKAKQKMLQEDWELFKMQRKLLDQQMQKEKIPNDGCSANFNETMQLMLSGSKSLPDDGHCPRCNKIQCPCDECSISHMLTCGLITPPETPVPEDELLMAVATPQLPSDASSQYLHVSLANAAATADKILETSSCHSSMNHGCNQLDHTRHLHHHQHLHSQAEFLLREVVDHHKQLNLVDVKTLNWGEVVDHDQDDDEEDDEDEDDDDDDDEEDDDDDDDDDDEVEEEDTNDVSASPTLPSLSPSPTPQQAMKTLSVAKERVDDEGHSPSSIGTRSSSSPETTGSSSESVVQLCECHVCTAPPINNSLPVNPVVDALLDRNCECQQHPGTLGSPAVLPQPLSLHLYPHIHGEINTTTTSHLLRPTATVKPLIHPHLYNLHATSIVIPSPGKHRSSASAGIVTTNNANNGMNLAAALPPNSMMELSSGGGVSHLQHTNCAATSLQEQFYRTCNNWEGAYDNKLFLNSVHKYANPHVVTAMGGGAAVAASAVSASVVATGDGKNVYGNLTTATGTELPNGNACLIPLNGQQSGADTNFAIPTPAASVAGDNHPMMSPHHISGVVNASFDRASSTVGANCLTINNPLPPSFLESLFNKGPDGIQSPPIAHHNAPQMGSLSCTSVGVEQNAEVSSSVAASNCDGAISQLSQVTGTSTIMHTCDLSVTNNGNPQVPVSPPTGGPAASKPLQQQQGAQHVTGYGPPVSANGVGLCSDPDCEGHPGDLDDSVDDSCSEQSSSTSTSNQKDSKHCDCCYCEVFGHGTPTVAPVSKNYIEMRERLRLRLTKRKSKCKNSPQATVTTPPALPVPPLVMPCVVSAAVQLKKETPSSQPVEDVDMLVSFINGTDGCTQNGKSSLSSKAAKRARQKQRKAEEKAKKKDDNRNIDNLLTTKKPHEPQQEDASKRIGAGSGREDDVGEDQCVTTTAQFAQPNTQETSPRVVSLESIMEEMRKGDLAGKGTKDSMLQRVIQAVKGGDPTPCNSRNSASVSSKEPTKEECGAKWELSLKSLVAAAGQAGLEIVPIPSVSPVAVPVNGTNGSNPVDNESEKSSAKGNAKKKKQKGSVSTSAVENGKTQDIVKVTSVEKKNENGITQQPSVIITPSNRKANGNDYCHGSIKHSATSNGNYPQLSPLLSQLPTKTIEVATNCKKPAVEIIALKPTKGPSDNVRGKKGQGNGSEKNPISLHVLRELETGKITVKVTEKNSKASSQPPVQQQAILHKNSTNGVSKKKKNKGNVVVPTQAPTAVVSIQQNPTIKFAPSIDGNGVASSSPSSAGKTVVQMTTQPKGKEPSVTVISISSPSQSSNKKTPVGPNKTASSKSNGVLANGTTPFHLQDMQSGTPYARQQGRMKNKKDERFTNSTINNSNNQHEGGSGGNFHVNEAKAAERSSKVELKQRQANGIQSSNHHSNVSSCPDSTVIIVEGNAIARNGNPTQPIPDVKPGHVIEKLSSTPSVMAAEPLTTRAKKNKKKKGATSDFKSIGETDEAFVPRDIDLDNGELDETEREIEAFKRFCWNSIPLANKEKVHVNLKDIVIKKKSVIGYS